MEKDQVNVSFSGEALSEAVANRIGWGGAMISSMIERSRRCLDFCHAGSTIAKNATTGLGQ
jgi:hypothetical protein